jgi:hypothetical protein
MEILKITPDSNGAHRNQTWGAAPVPDGYIAVPEQFESTWEQYKPFVTITVENGVIANMVDNPAARAAQEAADAGIVPEPTPDDRIAQLEAEVETYSTTVWELIMLISMM